MYMGILTEKSYFCALYVTFLRLVCILKLEGYVKWKNWRLMSTKCRAVDCYKQCIWGYWPKNQTFLRLVCIDRLCWKKSHIFCALQEAGVLSGKTTQWRLMSTFWHKLSGRGLVISNVYGDIDRKIIFLCPLRYIFEASVHFKVGRSFSSLC